VRTKQRDPTRRRVCHGSTWTDAFGDRTAEREFLTVQAAEARMPIDRDDELSDVRAKRHDRARRVGACRHDAAITAATISEIGNECHAAPASKRHPQELVADIAGRYARVTEDALVLIAYDTGLQA
jgi:hypothetical protein